MKIKICGITNLADAKCAVEFGADLIGFVFYSRSPRYILPQTAKEIIGKLPPNRVCVGVFVNETNKRIRELYEFCGLSYIQLHGHESIKQVTRLEPIPLIKALSLTGDKDLQLIPKYSNYQILVDTPSDSYGGTGKTGNWQLAAKISKSVPIFLAGGLTPANVAQAIREVQPFGVDVSSGVEKEKGIKDHQKIKDFIATVRRATENFTT